MKEHKETHTRTLPVKMTREELADRAKQLGELNEKVAELEAEKKAETQRMKELVEDAKGERDVLARHCRTGHEPRQVRCYESRDFARGVVDVYREDTGVVIETRPMQDAERQIGFADAGPMAVS